MKYYQIFLLLAFLITTGLSHNKALAAEASEQHKVVVYYLYMNPRCETCLNIEKFSKEAIDEAFAEELESGAIEWHAYDIGLPEHEHFWDDFQLKIKSLVMVEMLNDERVQWKICDEVWDLVEYEQAFKKYVQSEVQSYLISKP